MNIPSSFLSFFAILALSTLTTFPRTDFLSGRELQVVGAIVLICSFPLFFATFRENSYLSPMVRIQEDRGQTVVSTGPYHYVRHPMYAAALLFLLGTALLLGSGFGLLFGLILVAMIAGRAVLEEHTLREELQGYDSYMAQVKYRLIPYIW